MGESDMFYNACTQRKKKQELRRDSHCAQRWSCGGNRGKRRGVWGWHMHVAIGRLQIYMQRHEKKVKYETKMSVNQCFA